MKKADVKEMMENINQIKSLLDKNPDSPFIDTLKNNLVRLEQEYLKHSKPVKEKKDGSSKKI